jgi:23S rRNA (pseudouridine1915-N3)-methyltransferase
VLEEVPVAKRSAGSDVVRLVEREGEAMLKRVAKGARIVALDEHGKSYTTRALARMLEDWLGDGRNVSLLIGGPDGLSRACKDAAKTHWSLSPLTLPHGLARILVAEQLYRAWTVVQGHPYHRD